MPVGLRILTGDWPGAEPAFLGAADRSASASDRHRWSEVERSRQARPAWGRRPAPGCGGFETGRCAPPSTTGDRRCEEVAQQPSRNLHPGEVRQGGLRRLGSRQARPAVGVAALRGASGVFEPAWTPSSTGSPTVVAGGFGAATALVAISRTRSRSSPSARASKPPRSRGHGRRCAASDAWTATSRSSPHAELPATGWSREPRDGGRRGSQTRLDRPASGRADGPALWRGPGRGS